MNSGEEIPSMFQDETWFAMNAHSDAEKLARMRDQLVAFQRIASTIGSEASIEVVLKIICDNTTQLMRCERTTIFLVEEDAKHEQWLNSVIAEKSGVIRLRFGQGIAGTVALKRQTLNIKDVYQNALFDPSFDKKNGFKTRSCLAMPILNIQHEMLGVVQVINKINGYFKDDDDVEMLASICSQIGVSLTQHQFYMSLLNKNAELVDAREKLQQKNDELDMLYALEREAATSLDLNSLIERMLAKCLPAFRVKYAAILVNDKTQKQLYALQAAAKCEICVIERIPAFISTAIKHGECMRLSLREIQTLPEQTEAVFNVALNALLIAPLNHQDMSCGALILGTQKLAPGCFSASDAKLAALFAAHIAPSIAAQLDREENEKKQRLFVIGQMLSSLLHDMKTPLANISGYTELMCMQNDESLRAEFGEVIERQVNTLKNMSAEILQFARGQTSVILRKNPLHDVISHSLEQLAVEADKRHIEIRCDEKFRGSIYYDDDKLQRVIINLTKNAMEAIDKNGHIEISTYADDFHVYLMIRDDGPGIPPEIANSLFEAFVTCGKTGGTGLGLSIVRKIVEEHHASITWQPVEPHGTSFIMAFPCS